MYYQLSGKMQTENYWNASKLGANLVDLCMASILSLAKT
jgi:hypothetical protein